MDDLKVKELNSCCFVSGEPGTDVDNELFELMRRKYDGHTFVWIEKIDLKHVLVTISGSRHIIMLRGPESGPANELAILKETAQEKLVNSKSTGLVEMAAGVQPKVKVQAYGSGLNPNVQTHDDGKEVELFAVDGLFSTCDSCERTVCNLNGLTASIREEAHIVHVQWLGKHTCHGHRYSNFAIPSGSRIV